MGINQSILVKEEGKDENEINAALVELKSQHEARKQVCIIFRLSVCK